MKYYLLLALVLVTACTNLPFFGQDVIKIQVNTEAEGPKDSVVVKDIQTVPTSPMLPGQDVVLLFTIENRDNTETVTNVNVQLFNPSSFKITEGETQNLGSILPGEQRQVQIKLKAPSETDIARVKFESDLHFRVTYNFISRTVMEALVVNIDEILLRQRQGQPITLERNNILGPGPVQVQAEMKGVPYILAGQEQGGNFVFTIKNVGDKTRGDLLNGTINNFGSCGEDSCGLLILFPDGIGKLKCSGNMCSKFSCGPAPSSILGDFQGTLCINNEDIKLFKGESTPFRFEIDSSGISLTEPFKTYNVRAGVIYTYELRDSVHVIVNPLQNV